MRPLGPLLGTLIVASTLSAQQLTSVALPPATMEELAHVAVAPLRGEAREHDRLRRQMAMTTAENAIAVKVVVAPQSSPPPITRGFYVVTDPLPETGNIFPADASGAAGPRHVVGAFNNAITVHDRAGNLLSLITVRQFWHDPAAGDKALYDPRVAYDVAYDRWVIIMLGDDYPYARGVLFVAVSVSGDPTGGWRRFRVPVDPTAQLDVDKSHLAITTDTIVVTADVWNGEYSPVSTTIFNMPKAAAFTGPSLNISATPVAFFGSDLVPVTSSDTTLRFASAFNEALHVYDFVKLKESGDVSSGTSYTASIPSKPPVYCAQLGASITPDCGEPVVSAGVARDGTTWIVQQAFPTGALVWKITGSSATAYSIDAGALAISYPSLAVNKSGAALVGYAVMSASIYPSAAYSYIDPAGKISESAMVKDGEASYKRSRWGDFTTTVVDPVDDLSFWTLGIYANSILPGGFSRWGSWWSYVQVAPTPKTRSRAARH